MKEQRMLAMRDMTDKEFIRALANGRIAYFPRVCHLPAHGEIEPWTHEEVEERILRLLRQAVSLEVERW